MLPQFVRFIVVGVAGFLLDALILMAAIGFASMGPLSARLFSFPPAFLLTWSLNRYWTFDDGHLKPSGRQLTTYFIIQAAGFFVNYAIYATTLKYVPNIVGGPIGALVIATGFVALQSFLLAKYFAFSKP